MEHYQEAIFSLVTILISIVGNVATTRTAIGAMKEQISRLSESFDKLSETVSQLRIQVGILENTKFVAEKLVTELTGAR